MMTTRPRSAQVREALKAIIRGDIPEYWVRTYAPVSNAEEAAQYAGLDEDEWREVQAGWAELYRDRGIDGETGELVSQHIQTRYGVGRAQDQLNLDRN